MFLEKLITIQKKSVAGWNYNVGMLQQYQPQRRCLDTTYTYLVVPITQLVCISRCCGNIVVPYYLHYSPD